MNCVWIADEVSTWTGAGFSLPHLGRGLTGFSHPRFEAEKIDPFEPGGFNKLTQGLKQRLFRLCRHVA